MKPPIADPFGLPEDRRHQRPESIFRVEFWRFSVMNLVGALSWSLPVVGLLLVGERPEVQAAALIGGILAGLATTLLLSCICYWVTPTKVSFHRLKSTNFWGGYREIEWAQIQNVRFRWFFLPYAIISTSQKRNFIWLPLFLRDMKSFAHAVEELAPADNLLRLFLQKRQFK